MSIGADLSTRHRLASTTERPVDLQPIADEIAVALRPQAGQQGRVATHIPALSRVRADSFWIGEPRTSGASRATHSSMPIS